MLRTPRGVGPFANPVGILTIRSSQSHEHIADQALAFASVTGDVASHHLRSPRSFPRCNILKIQRVGKNGCRRNTSLPLCRRWGTDPPPKKNIAFKPPAEAPPPRSSRGGPLRPTAPCPPSSSPRSVPRPPVRQLPPPSDPPPLFNHQTDHWSVTGDWR